MEVPQLTIFRPPLWKDNPLFVHAFFGRTGGESISVNKSLNCSYSTDDIEENVTKNRRTALACLEATPSQLCVAQQCHSNTAIVIEKPFLPLAAPKADGLVTKNPQIFLGLLTADCAPVLFVDTKNKVIGAAHAGWRGALSGIIKNTVMAMESLGAQPQHIEAAIGPYIHQQSYEVDPIFRQQFLQHDSSFDSFFLPAPKPEHFLFDLVGFVASRIKATGIQKGFRLPFDTYRYPDKLFSHRRCSQKTGRTGGRQLSVIALHMPH